MARDYHVLISLDGGTTWAHSPKPVTAASPQAAAEQIRKASPELHANEDAQFLALTRFNPIAKRKQLIEAWRWGKVAGHDELAQAELPDG